MWNSLLLSIVIIKCISYRNQLKHLHNHVQQWKNNTLHELNLPQNWTFIPYDLQPYEIDFLIAI